MGLANIVPGVSGGTMAVSMGIYDKLIHCVSHLFTEFKKSILFLIPIFLGMGIAIVGGAFGIEKLFETFPLPTNLFFIGLIIGSLPIIWKNVKGSKISVGHAIVFVLFFALVAGLALLNGSKGADADLTFSVGNVIILLFIGILASATMVIPGVSGSMVLLLIGYYHPVISAITDFVAALKNFDMNGILKGVGILAPFGIGVVVGIFAIAKLVEIIFKKFPLYAYWAIIGLIVASPIAILLVAGIPAISVLSVIAAVFAFVAGFIIAMKLGG